MNLAAGFLRVTYGLGSILRTIKNVKDEEYLYFGKLTIALLRRLGHLRPCRLQPVVRHWRPVH